MARDLETVTVTLHGDADTDGATVALTYSNGERVAQEYGRQEIALGAGWYNGRHAGVRYSVTND